MIRIIALTIILFASCSDSDRMYKKTSVAMNTEITITVVDSNAKHAEQAIDSAMQEIRELEGRISFWSDKSDIANIASYSGTAPVKVSPETLYLIKKSQFVSEKTSGAFDPTLGPVIRLWDFKRKILPDAGAIKNALSLVDYRKMSIDNAGMTAYLNVKGMAYDTGGIAKGYAADRAVEALKEQGIKAGLVSVSGDIKAFGLRPDGAGWKVGIKDPRSENTDSILGYIELKDEAISTSGDYERYFIVNGVRYHHILDSKTGYPVRGTNSATVLSKDAVMTDGLSTGVFAMGAEKGMRLLGELGLEGIIIDETGRFHVSDGLKNRFVAVTGKLPGQ